LNNPYRYVDPDGLAPAPIDKKLLEQHGTAAAIKNAQHVTSKILLSGAMAVMELGVMPSASGVIGSKGTSKAPDFVVTPKGEAIPVPSGATGPTPTRALGFQYTGGSGGHGLDTRTTGVRIMEGNANQGPRAVYMNQQGQTINPATGRTVPNSDPAAHHYLDP
jgi:hypothetical protein